jgi:hypothetical protein
MSRCQVATFGKRECGMLALICEDWSLPDVDM